MKSTNSKLSSASFLMILFGVGGGALFGVLVAAPEKTKPAVNKKDVPAAAKKEVGKDDPSKPKPADAPKSDEKAQPVDPKSEKKQGRDGKADKAKPDKKEEEDDDFGGGDEDEFGSKKMADDEDEFGSGGDDEFGLPGDQSEGEGGLLPDKDESGDASTKPRTYKTAAEAHLTFLKALESEKRFPAAATCAGCHPDHYREWSVSPHAYAQMSPVFNTMHAAIVTATSGTNGDFCIRCHTQVGMQREEPLFTSNIKRHPASVEGITCVVCHRIDRAYGKVSGRTHVVQGDIFEGIYGPSGGKILDETLTREDLKNKLNVLRIDPKTGKPPKGKKHVHAKVVKFDPIATSGFCGTCHDVNLLNGFRLEEAFSQFKNTHSNARGETCQDCHMGKIPGGIASKVSKKLHPVRFDRENYAFEPAARIGGDIWAKEGDPDSGNYGIATRRRKRTNHMFIGPDYSIVEPAIFPHSEKLRQALWDYEHIDPKTKKTERLGLEHLIEFRWADGWGDLESAFEKRIEKNPNIEKSLPWPWDDAIARMTLRDLLNDQFRLLNEANRQRYQLLRRAIRLTQFEVTKNDAKGVHFKILVENGTDGHGVPTGFDAERLMFLQVNVRDSKGRIVYRSGDRDPNGDVRDLHSSFVHHHAKKTGAWLAQSAWKGPASLKFRKEDLYWNEDRHLFSLQSKFLTRNHRGGEREQVLAINYSVDPLPYIRPDTRPGILVGRPSGARKHSRGLPPKGRRWAEYKIDRAQLTASPPYTAEVKFVCQMVPINLISTISKIAGFDYNLSPREVSKRVVWGHRVNGNKKDSSRRGGAQVIWDMKLPIRKAGSRSNIAPTEAQIMATPPAAFPYRKNISSGGLE